MFVCWGEQECEVTKRGECGLCSVIVPVYNSKLRVFPSDMGSWDPECRCERWKVHGTMGFVKWMDRCGGSEKKPSRLLVAPKNGLRQKKHKH